MPLWKGKRKFEMVRVPLRRGLSHDQLVQGKTFNRKDREESREVRQEMQQSFTEKSREDRKKADEIAKR